MSGDLHALCIKGLYSRIGLSLTTKHCAFLWTVSAIGKAYAPVLTIIVTDYESTITHECVIIEEPDVEIT